MKQTYGKFPVPNADEHFAPGSSKDYENLTDEQVRQFEDAITMQNIPIVESQQPELLPLDLQAELHLRSDRTAIAYRRWLKELGLTFGMA